MFKVIAVDDEKYALDRFERIMSEQPLIEVIGKFTNAESAIEFVKRNRVDIAFLDIEMPGVNGLELAEKLNTTVNFIEVVFVTAYDKYALQAFQAYAIGYLLKPLDAKEVENSINNIIKKLQYRMLVKPAARLNVKCFGQFSCYSEQNESDIIRFRTTKAKELFALLIHHQGKPVSKDTLIDTLWPEIEPDRAANNFRVTCTYLRGALADKGFTNILLREHDSYFVNTLKLNCDLFQFIATINSPTLLNLERLETTSTLYINKYLDETTYEWAIYTKNWLQNEYKKIQNRLADEYIKLGENKKACEALANIIKQDSCDEDTIIRLIMLLLELNENNSAAMVYKNYEKALWNDLELRPSEKLKVIAKKF